MRYFTILFFLLCLRFTTHTYKQEHIHKSPHFPPNPFNLFTDISHFESFHLFPSSTLSVSPHLLLFINSSIQIPSSIILSSFTVSFPQSWNTHSPSSGWWCWAESWPVSSELYSPQCTINPELSEIIFTPQLSCWSPHGYPLTQWNMAPTYRFLTISFHLWHLLVIQSYTLLVSLVKVVVLLSFFDHSWNSKSSALEIFLHLNLLNSWLLNFQLATRKPSFSTSIDLHLPKCLLFLTNSKIYLKSLFLRHLSSSSVVTSISMLILTLLLLTNFLASLTISISRSTSTFQLMTMVTPLTFSSHDSSSTFVTHLSQHESYQSDHKSFTFKFYPHTRPPTERTTIQYCSYKTIDVDNFKSDILTSPLYTNPASNASDLADQLSSTLKSILDIHAPIKSKTVVQRPHTPWINPEILQAKRERSRLERCWRRWKSPFDRMKFRAQCNSVRSLISKAKSSFLSNLVTESSDNPRTLGKTLNTILHRNPSNSLPESPDAPSLANTFLDFFKDKIERIRTKFLPSDSPDPFLFPPAPPPKLINFIPATLTEIHKLISSSENKQCLLDSIPTFLLKLCFNELGPIITNLVNLSLSEGIFPSSFKQALVQPLLKKPSLSTDDLNNFRPISNLNFISKILEKVVASRIQSHLSSNSLSSSFQSAYRIFHSTETTLLKIHNDLILAMDRGEVTSLILLDLSAAFDTVDHSILLTRLQNWFGLDGLSLAWFTSYLSSRSQAVSINDSISAFSSLSCGVPQGSVLGPLLFTLYTTPLCSVISKNSLKYHLYADDTQLYISFTPTNCALSLDTLTTTFNDILSWMNLNKLLLNPSKTEFLLIGTKQQRLKFSDLTNLSLSNDIIPVSSSARNLGFIFDSDMSFSDQIKSVSKSCHFHIRDIRRIRHLLPLSAATALANSLVSSKLDYCNSLYSGISQVNLNKLQRIQNSLARVITNTSKYQHITPILKKLHWLPIKQRIDYKLCLLTYKTLTNQQPNISLQ